MEAQLDEDTGGGRRSQVTLWHVPQWSTMCIELPTIGGVLKQFGFPRKRTLGTILGQFRTISLRSIERKIGL